MTDDRILSRRQFLAAAGGVAGVAGIGYVGARRLARKGEIIVRMVGGEEREDDTLVGGEDLFYEEIAPDGPHPERRFHPEYRQYFPADPPITVSAFAHRELQHEFDRVTYAVSHSCPDAYCTSPQLSRYDFNGVRVGEDVRLLYHAGSGATVIP